MRILFVIPGDINLPTGGYRYDRRIIEEWRKAGHFVELLSLQGDYPFPSEAQKKLALEQIGKVSEYNVAVVDGLAGGVLLDFMEQLAKKMPLVALVHHPLCLEKGLSEEAAESLKASEKAGLKYALHIVTTSPETARSVNSLFGIDLENISSVLPGVERGIVSSPPENGQINLLCVGSIIERKGHIHLIEALAKLKQLNWHLDCIGKTDFQPDLFKKLLALVESQELRSRVTFHGSVGEEQLLNFYQNAHVFVLPSLFEGYGMVYAEAIVKGIPVIGTNAGAIPDTVPSDCGILVKPANSEELAKALIIMISDREKRQEFRAATMKATESFPTWEDSAQKFTKILESIA